ncbi:MAG: D-2-hydroxyacid dehydrogenase, partial [Sphingomonadaceae bacterium]
HTHSPRTTELYESRALIIGYGAIGSAIGERLKGFGVQVTGVKRTPSDDPTIVTPDRWRGLIGDYDWVILAAPSTGETKALIGESELAAMKSSAWLINIARGDVVDQDALISALQRCQLAGAFLDVTTPEPLPTESPLWSMPNAILTSHLSGRAQTKMFQRSAQLFLRNLERYRADEPLENQVDLLLGY